jgi:hypothetical protein
LGKKIGQRLRITQSSQGEKFFELSPVSWQRHFNQMDASDDFSIGEGLPFPWGDVEASRKNHPLQKKDPATDREPYLADAKPCPKCRTRPAQLTWLYFESPAWTWGDALCGRAGWLSLCDNCHLQVEFFEEVMS